MLRRTCRCVLAAAVATGVAAGTGAADAEEPLVSKDKGCGPPAGAKWEPIPELTDEFEGDRLDAAKWHDHNPTWKGRQPAFFARHNVKVSDGKLHLTMRREDLKGLPAGYHTFTSAAVQSKALVRYGYFEIRCRPMDSHGSSAFWFYHGTPEIWTEIDVFEIGGGAPKHERTYHMNAHVFHTLVDPDRHWSRGGKWEAPYRLADAYHVYALEWSPEFLKYYVDGTCVREMPNTHWHQPLTMNFDSETMPNWFGLPDPNDLPSTFSIEYVRSWRKVDGQGFGRCRSCEFRFDAKEAAAARGQTGSYRLAGEGKGRLSVVAKHGGESRPARVHLEYDDEAFFAAQGEASIEKEIRVRDAKGSEVSFAFTWTKTKGHQPNHGYRADRVEVLPAETPAPGKAIVCEFTSEEGAKVRVKLQY